MELIYYDFDIYNDYLCKLKDMFYIEVIVCWEFDY
jgi:hypothetical protein